jgi:hypothetical protein
MRTFKAWQLNRWTDSVQNIQTIVTKLHRIQSTSKDSPSDVIHAFNCLCHACKQFRIIFSESPASIVVILLCVFSSDSKRHMLKAPFTFEKTARHTGSIRRSTADVPKLVFACQKFSLFWICGSLDGDYEG